MQTGSGRAPLIIAIAAALITYAALGPQTPFGFLHHLGSHKITISTDKVADAAEAAREEAEQKAEDARQKAEDARQAAEDRAQEARDRAQDQADRERQMRDQTQELRDQAQKLGEQASQLAQAVGEKAVAVVKPFAEAPIPPTPPAPPAAPAVLGPDSEVLGLDTFDCVTIENNANATIAVGESQSVSISGGLGHTDAKVHDGKLVISGSIPGTKVAITVPHLKSVEANGYGDVSLKGLRDPITIKANGAIKLTASGTVESAELVLNGPSRFDFAQLQAKNLTVKINGVGDADVYATDNLVAYVEGVGHVRYRGDPHLVTKINGPGTVQHLSTNNQG